MEENTWESAEETEMDRDHIKAVLSANTDQVKLKSSGHILFDFSQCAKVAGDPAMNYPETYCGAIVMSPGGKKTIQTTRLHHRLDTVGRFTNASSARTNPMETFL